MTRKEVSFIYPKKEIINKLGKLDSSVRRDSKSSGLDHIAYTSSAFFLLQFNITYCYYIFTELRNEVLMVDGLNGVFPKKNQFKIINIIFCFVSRTFLIISFGFLLVTITNFWWKECMWDPSFLVEIWKLCLIFTHMF